MTSSSIVFFIAVEINCSHLLFLNCLRARGQPIIMQLVALNMTTVLETCEIETVLFDWTANGRATIERTFVIRIRSISLTGLI